MKKKLDSYFVLIDFRHRIICLQISIWMKISSPWQGKKSCNAFILRKCKIIQNNFLSFVFFSICYFLFSNFVQRVICDPFFFCSPQSIEQAVFSWRFSPRYWPSREHPMLLRSYSRFPLKVFIGQWSAASVRCLNKGADIDSSPLFSTDGSPVEFLEIFRFARCS